MALVSPFLAPDDSDEMPWPESDVFSPEVAAQTLAGACSALACAVAVDAGFSPLVLGGSMGVGFLGLCAWQSFAYSIVGDERDERDDAPTSLPDSDSPTTTQSPQHHGSGVRARVRPDTIAARVRARHRSATQ